MNNLYNRTHRERIFYESFMNEVTMKNRTIILDMNGKIIKRQTKTDKKGDEYITHKKMKAYLEVNKVINTPNGDIVTFKKISYYM